MHNLVWWGLVPFIESLEWVYLLGATNIMGDVWTLWGEWIEFQGIHTTSKNSELWCNCSWFVENTLEFTKCSLVIHGFLSVDVLYSRRPFSFLVLLFSYFPVGQLFWTWYFWSTPMDNIYFLITYHK